DAKAALLVDRCDVERLRAARSFRDFDDAVTAPLHGFDGAEDYYRRSSSHQFLPAIRVPTLLLHAADDPFLPGRHFPRQHVASNPYLTALVTARGGHVGFIGGTPWRPRFWAEETAAAWLAELLFRAADAPWLPGRHFQRHHVASSPSLAAVVTASGGHVGFIGGTPWRPRIWAEATAAAWLAEQLSRDSDC